MPKNWYQIWYTPPSVKSNSTEWSSCVSATPVSGACAIGSYFSTCTDSTGIVPNGAADGEYAIELIVTNTLWLASSGTNTTFM